MTSTHEFHGYADVLAALAAPQLIPVPAADETAPLGTMAWLRSTVARFSSGENHARRRALVEADLARLDPAALRRAAASAPAAADPRSTVVRVLAEALQLAEPAAVAEAITVIAGTYFGGEDPAADAAVAWLLPRVAPQESGPEGAANRIGLLVQACDATGALVGNVRRCPAGHGDLPAESVRETVRHDPPVRVMRRIAESDVRVGQVAITQGDLVVLDIAAANRDPKVFADPDTFDRNRSGPRSLTFGAAPRLCPGHEHALALAAGILDRDPAAAAPATGDRAEPHAAGPLRRPADSGSSSFSDLHRGTGAPLLLPNAWDHASAAALAAQGFRALGTTSLGVAAAAGLPDGTGATRAETLLLARRLGRGPFLLSVDVEGGFSDDPSEVAAFALELAGAGAVGINLEDGRGDGTLTPIRLHAAKIAAVKAAVPELFVNARADTHWLGTGQQGTADRLDAYQQAGADGVFVPGLTDPGGIAALVAAVDVPLNILYSPTGPSLGQLGELGVRRVSLGSLLFRLALDAAVGAAVDLRAGRPVGKPRTAYGDVQGLAASHP